MLQLNQCQIFTVFTQCFMTFVFVTGDRISPQINHQVDFKSHQWFGATVRSHDDTILVR